MSSSVRSTLTLSVPSTRTVEAFRLYTTDDIAHILGVPKKAVYGLGIPEIRPTPRAIRYMPSAFSRWLDDRSR
jgi:hypothetical protein